MIDEAWLVQSVKVVDELWSDCCKKQNIEKVVEREVLR